MIKYHIVEERNFGSKPDEAVCGEIIGEDGLYLMPTVNRETRLDMMQLLLDEYKPECICNKCKKWFIKEKWGKE